MKQMVFLSGLPRTGSTLLSAILSQNPLIHAEGNSAVCQLMWDMHVSCSINSNEQLSANDRFDTILELLTSIPKIYYKDIEQPIIVDKCRSWTLQPNIDLILKYITKEPKFIVLIRPLEEIVASFVHLKIENGWTGNLTENILRDGSEPIMRSFDGIINVLSKYRENTIFVKYDDLVSNTEKTIENIYNFCGWQQFDHSYNDIENKYPENDEVYGLLGQHYVRPKIEKRKIEIDLPKEILEKCHFLNELIGL